MFSQQPSHRVSAKGALYSHDLKAVLIMNYEGGKMYGLPGGHVELDENPDAALVREVKEELDLDLAIETIVRKDFFKISPADNRIILGYTAILPDNVVFEATNPKREYAEWVEANVISGIPHISEQYKRFVLDNWPQSKPV